MVLRRWILITLLLSFWSSSVFAQVNLVRNGDFETYSACPSKNDQIMLATGWSPLDTVTKHTDNSGNSNCSPEYYHECGIGKLTVPTNQMGYQFPHTGKGMAAVMMYNGYDTFTTYYVRDYLVGRLVKALIAGSHYCVTFYVVQTEHSGIGIKEIGAYLDNGSICATQYCGVPQSQYTPQVVNSGGVITDTMQWTKIEGSFIANGTEKYITIGNFKDRTHTTTVKMPLSNTVAHYLIDDVSVVESSTVANAGPDTHVGAGDSVFIGRKDVAMDCSWTVLGSLTIIGTGAGIWVRPKTATSYVVTQTLCGVVTKDTVRVEVWAAGVHSINGQTQQFDIAPNPNDGNMQLFQLITDNLPVEVKVYNTVGALVYKTNKTFTGNVAELTLEKLTPGMYYINLQDSTGKTYTLRFIKQ